MTTKSQVRKLDQLSKLLYELASKKRSNYVAPKIERRINKWYLKKLKILVKIFLAYIKNSNELNELKYYQDSINRFYQQTVEFITIRQRESETQIAFYLPSVFSNYDQESGYETEINILSLLDEAKFSQDFEKLLRPVDYSIHNTTVNEFGKFIVYNLVNIKARTKAVKKPRYLYHITSLWDEKIIRRKGLLPMEGRGDESYTTYKNRIYLIIDPPNTWDLKRMKLTIPVIRENGEFVVFRVDTRKFNRFNIFELELDLKDYVWTPTHIPAKALKVVFRKTDTVNMLDFMEWTERQK